MAQLNLSASGPTARAERNRTQRLGLRFVPRRGTNLGDSPYGKRH
jgi:hypothetical protein